MSVGHEFFKPYLDESQYTERQSLIDQEYETVLTELASRSLSGFKDRAEIANNETYRQYGMVSATDDLIRYFGSMTEDPREIWRVNPDQGSKKEACAPSASAGLITYTDWQDTVAQAENRSRLLQDDTAEKTLREARIAMTELAAARYRFQQGRSSGVSSQDVAWHCLSKISSGGNWNIRFPRPPIDAAPISTPETGRLFLRGVNKSLSAMDTAESCEKAYRRDLLSLIYAKYSAHLPPLLRETRNSAPRTTAVSKPESHRWKDWTSQLRLGSRHSTQDGN